MIKHIYLFRLKENIDSNEVIQKLYTLAEHIPEIQEIEIGQDFRGAQNSYDICEYLTFNNMEDFEAFTNDPYHDSIRKYMAGVQASGVKIDYTC